MATLKDMRLTFYYADENVFEKVKNEKSREKLVKWADEFYARYGFKIDQFPVCWNEKLYKRDFCLAKTSGLKIIYTQLFLQMEILILDLASESLRLIGELNDMTSDSTIGSEYSLKNLELKFVQAQLSQAVKSQVAINYHRPFDFRKAVFLKAKETNPKYLERRLVVVLCEFQFHKKPFAVGETFDANPKIAIYSLFNSVFRFGEGLFGGPMVFIDVNFMQQPYEFVLAHEIVHSINGTTDDGDGAAGNIMIAKDAKGKAATSVTLEPNDKTRLDVAFFVV
ncbi:MAG: hypothetical protein V4722_10630 [Bacteroidota bacterium]